MLIKVGDMVREMRKTIGNNRPKPFSLIYATADRKRKTGGGFREIQRAILITKKRTPDRTLCIQPLGTQAMVLVHLDLILYFNSQPVA